MGFIELLLLSVSLAMDAFAVSICGSMALSPENRVRGALRFGLWFGLFQAIMPFLGYIGALSFREYIIDYDHWIAFALLFYLGINMIREACDQCSVKKSYSTREMFMLSVATSIDALAVGVSLAFLETDIWLSIALIGVTTFIISAFGGIAGFRLGAAAGKKADIFGGAVLMCIGFKILLEHTGMLTL